MNTNRRWHIIANLATLLLLTAGCGVSIGSSESPSAGVPALTGAPSFEPTPAVQVSPPTAAATATAPPSTSVPATPTNGSSVPAPLPTPETIADGDATWLRVNGFGPGNFGDPAIDVEAWVSAFFGPPTGRFDQPECGGGPSTSLNWEDFSLLMQDGQFVGWFYTTSSPVLTSPSSVTPGINRAQLEQVYVGVNISETTLGQEFFFEVPAGYMGGFLTADGERVTEMFAGSTCFFR